MEFQLLALKLHPRCAANITSRTYKQSSDTELVNCVMMMRYLQLVSLTIQIFYTLTAKHFKGFPFFF